MAPPPIITFLDHDHILRIVALGLTGPDAAAEAYARALFAPDEIDIPAVRAMARGLTAAEGGIVRHAIPPTPKAVAGSTILIGRRGAVTAEMIAACPDLKLIQRLGERSDGLDLAAAAARGIPVSCLPRPSLAYTAEHAMLLMLALAKKLAVADRLVRRGGWDECKVQPADNVAYNWAGVPDVGGLSGKTLGIIGLGEVGMLLARRARAFDMTVLYHNRRSLPAARDGELGIAYAAMADLLAGSDFVALTAANLPENDRLIGAAAFAAMKPSACFVNISRGRMVDEDALYGALTGGRIAGAGLDVHRIEPRPPGDRFAALDTVIMTPHLAGGSRRHVLEEVRQIYENCRAALDGAKPPHGEASG
jgi:phosphoglycerate dehydrogenase-like enzyme